MSDLKFASEWARFRARNLVFMGYGLVDPTLLQKNGTPHPLAGVVGRAVARADGFDVQFPDELVERFLQANRGDGMKAIVPIKAWIPLPETAVEPNQFFPRSWRLSSNGIDVLSALGVKTLPASVGFFDVKRSAP
jgi:hypothetical protein